MLPYVHMCLHISYVYCISTVMPAACREWPVLVLALVHETHVITRHETPLVRMSTCKQSGGRGPECTPDTQLQAYMHMHVNRYSTPS